MQKKSEATEETSPDPTVATDSDALSRHVSSEAIEGESAALPAP
jgi:hypothetical protein